jgi:phage baseplate assembly protein W
MAARTFSILGSDLALTRYVGTPAAVPLDSADSWGSLDVSVVPGGRGGLKTPAAVQDLGRVDGRANLAQALILRLITPRGSLAQLGHPSYGSRLVSLVGELNNETTRNLARLYTLEALAEEPRVKQPVQDLSVQSLETSPDVLRIGFSVLPIDDSDPLALSLEVQL